MHANINTGSESNIQVLALKMMRANPKASPREPQDAETPRHPLHSESLMLRMDTMLMND